MPFLWWMNVLVSPMEYFKKILKWLNFLQCWRDKQPVIPNYLRLQSAVFVYTGKNHLLLHTMATGSF